MQMREPELIAIPFVTVRAVILSPLCVAVGYTNLHSVLVGDVRGVTSRIDHVHPWGCIRDANLGFLHVIDLS